MDSEVMNVERTCRGCLREGGELRSLFTIDENSRQHEPRLNEMLMSSTQIQIRENDGLPSQICGRCSHQLYSAYSFKHMCEVSDAKLKKLASNVQPSEKNDYTTDKTANPIGVKEEHMAASGNVDIIDFNTMFTSDLPSIKVEVRDLNEAPLFGGEVKKDMGIADPVIAALKNNEKSTQTKLTDVVQVHNCSQCQKKFKTILSLSSHMKRHMSTDVVPCMECGKFYVSQELVQKHMLQIHGITNAKKKSSFLLKCQLCKLTFKKSENLKKHMIVHGKKKIYNCENCELGYNKFENYQSHLSSCNGRFYNCPICKKNFKSTEALSLHKNLVHERDDDFVGDNKIEILPIELPDNLSPKQINGMPDKAFRSGMTNSDMTIIPQVTIKEEPLDELLEEAERENLNYENDGDGDGEGDGDSYTDMLADDPMDGNNSEEMRSDCSEYKPMQLKKRKGLRGRKRQFDPKRKHKLKRVPKTELDEIGEFPCNLCDRVLTTEINLKVHLAKHTGDTILFSCVICEKTFNNVHRLRRHELAHESFNKYKCNTCDKTFNRQDHLNKHMWSHVDTKPYTCDLCPKGFFKAEHLERHKMALHSGKQKNPKTAFCSICNRGFTTSKYLDTHMRMHTGDKTFTCKVCDKSFNSKWHLKEHNKWHSAEKPFLCSECGQRFIRNDYLVIHMRRHKGEKPYKCKFCGKGFPRATDLTVHERYHTGEKTHLCTICGKGFQRQYNLTVHLRVHTGEKPYVCSYCSKRFAQGNDLKSHVRRHTGERFNCDICGEGFIQGYHLTQHKRSVHGIDCTSHIRRVEKHPEANPQNLPNQIPKHRTRVTSSTQVPTANAASTEEPAMPPLHIFSNASQAVTVSQESDNDQSTLQSQISAEEVDNSIPPLVPIVPVALFATMHTRMH